LSELELSVFMVCPKLQIKHSVYNLFSNAFSFTIHYDQEEVLLSVLL